MLFRSPAVPHAGKFWVRASWKGFQRPDDARQPYLALLIGETDFAGIPKLMVAEARNFPEVAQFYYENVIKRGRALVGAALERGMASGEFRRMDVETCIEVVIAPVLMLLIWRYSMGSCQGKQVDPAQYLALHMDLLRQGLQRTRV